MTQTVTRVRGPCYVLAAMWMVIFGAGASYDSVPTDRWSGRINQDFVPPVTLDLFEQREFNRKAWTNFPACAPLVNELWYVAQKAIEDSSAPGVEEFLQSLVDKYGADLPLTRQLLALRFYLHEVVQNTVGRWMTESGPATNYATLLAWMQRLGGDLLLVTFNYDSMLEVARHVVFGTTYNEVDSYLEGPAPLIRPHGYIGWRRLVEYPSAEPSVLIQEAGHYNLTDHIYVVGQQNEYAEIPAIAIPTRGKADFECPTPHIDKLKQLLPDVTQILTVGWRGQEETFLSVARESGLRDQLPGLIVSRGAQSAKEIARHLGSRFNSAELEASEARGFSDFIRLGIEQISKFG